MILDRIVNKSSSRSRRRWIVVGFYVGLALSAGLALAAPDSGSYLLAAFVFLLVSVFILRALWSSTQYVADASEGLDERQWMVQGRANSRAYFILSMALMLVLFYLVLALEEYREAQLWLPPPDRLNLLLTFVVFLVIGLPTTIVAWTEPDPEE